MFAGLRRHLTYANVVSTLCLFVVLGGSVYAASTLSRNSVLSKHIKNGEVKSKDVRDRSLREKDFAEGELPRGAKGEQGEPGMQGEQGTQGEQGIQGEQGDQGIQGDPGTAKGYISVAATQAPGSTVLNPPRSKGVLSVFRPDTATDSLFCFDLNFDPEVAVGSTFINNNAIVRTAVRKDYDPPSGSPATTVAGCAGTFDASAKVAATDGTEQTDVHFSLLFD